MDNCPFSKSDIVCNTLISAKNHFEFICKMPKPNILNIKQEKPQQFLPVKRDVLSSTNSLDERKAERKNIRVRHHMYIKTVRNFLGQSSRGIVVRQSAML